METITFLEVALLAASLMLIVTAGWLFFEGVSKVLRSDDSGEVVEGAMIIACGAICLFAALFGPIASGTLQRLLP